MQLMICMLIMLKNVFISSYNVSSSGAAAVNIN